YIASCPTRRPSDLLQPRRGQDHHRSLAAILQHQEATLVAWIQATGTGGHHLACASKRSSTVICPGNSPKAEHELRLKPDHPMGSGQQLRLVQRQIDDLVPHLIRDAVPNPVRPGPAIFQRIDATGKEAIIPAIEGRARNAELLQRAPRRQVRVLDQADDLQLLECGVSHSSSPPSAIMLFLRIRSSSACSATTSLRSRASLRSTFTSSLVAARAVSPASRFLPASRNSFDQL